MQSSGGQRRQYRAIAGPLLTCALLAARFCIHPEGETDAGWHIALGRRILAGDFPRTNALSWTAPDFPWYPTSWLYDVVVALSADHLPGPGALGPQLVTAALLLLALAGVALACARAAAPSPGSSADGSAWLAPAAFFLLLPAATPRPFMVSWAIFAWVLALCLGSRGRGPGARLLALGLVALGGNAHAGAAFAAFALGCFALQEAVEARREGRDWRPELALLAGAPLALLANPGGAFNVRYLVAHLHVQEVVRLAEFQHPTLLREPGFFALVLPVTALALRSVRRRPALAAVVCAFALLGLRSQRLIQFFLLAAVPVLAAEAPEMLARLGDGPARRRVGALVSVLAFTLAAAAAQVGFRLRASWDASWNAHLLPVRAVRFAEAHGLAGRGFNGFADGGYLEYARPQVPTFADGRVQAWPPAFFRAWADAERTPASFRAFLRDRGVEWALSSRLGEPLGGHGLLDDPAWALVYWDDASEVWLRRDLRKHAAIIEALEYRLFRPYGNIVAGVAALSRDQLPLLEAEVLRFLESSPADLFAGIVACASASRLGKPGAAALCDAVDGAAVAAARPDAAALVARARLLR